MDSSLISKDERMWAMLAHFSALLGFIGIPLANILAPLIIWQVKKEDMPFVALSAKECLNFQISVTIYSIICVLLVFVFIGVPLIFAVGIAALVLTIIAGVKANDGVLYRYPMTIRFIK